MSVDSYARYNHNTTPESVKSLLENRLVTDVKKIGQYKGKYSLLISFDGTDKKLKLSADSDSFGECWFELYLEIGYGYMINKTITRIYDSESQESDGGEIVVFEFSDGTEFKLILKNSSDGYYPSSLEITILDSDASIVYSHE